MKFHKNGFTVDISEFDAFRIYVKESLNMVKDGKITEKEFFQMINESYEESPLNWENCLVIRYTK